MGVAKAGITLTSGVIRRILNELGELTEQGKSFDDAITTLTERFGESRVRDTIQIAGERITQFIRKPVAVREAEEAARRAAKDLVRRQESAEAFERARLAAGMPPAQTAVAAARTVAARTPAAARTAARQAVARKRPASLTGEVPARVSTPRRNIPYGEGPYPQDFPTREAYEEALMRLARPRISSPRSAVTPRGRTAEDIIKESDRRTRGMPDIQDVPDFLRRGAERQTPEDYQHAVRFWQQVIRNRSSDIKLPWPKKATGGLVTQKKSKVKKSRAKKTNTKKKAPVKKSRTTKTRKRKSVKNTRTKK